MGVLSSFPQLDKSSVKLWNDLPEQNMGEDKGMGLKIAEMCLWEREKEDGRTKHEIKGFPRGYLPSIRCFAG
ncbi:unnamed protein product [Prunus armeniaca]